jgi:hypothetical protein
MLARSKPGFFQWSIRYLHEVYNTVGVLGTNRAEYATGQPIHPDVTFVFAKGPKKYRIVVPATNGTTVCIG